MPTHNVQPSSCSRPSTEFDVSFELEARCGTLSLDSLVFFFETSSTSVVMTCHGGICFAGFEMLHRNILALNMTMQEKGNDMSFHFVFSKTFYEMLPYVSQRNNGKGN